MSLGEEKRKNTQIDTSEIHSTKQIESFTQHQYMTTQYGKLDQKSKRSIQGKQPHPCDRTCCACLQPSAALTRNDARNSKREGLAASPSTGPGSGTLSSVRGDAAQAGKVDDGWDGDNTG